MALSIEEIRELKNNKKRKWGKDLINHLNPYFSEGYRYEKIIVILKSEYNITMNIDELTHLKNKYYNKSKVKERKKNINFEEQETITSNSEEIRQNKESTINNIFDEKDILQEINQKAEVLSKQRGDNANNDFKNKFLKNKK